MGVIDGQIVMAMRQDHGILCGPRVPGRHEPERRQCAERDPCRSEPCRLAQPAGQWIGHHPAGVSQRALGREKHTPHGVARRTPAHTPPPTWTAECTEMVDAYVEVPESSRNTQ